MCGGKVWECGVWGGVAGFGVSTAEHGFRKTVSRSPLPLLSSPVQPLFVCRQLAVVISKLDTRNLSPNTPSLLPLPPLPPPPRPPRSPPVGSRDQQAGHMQYVLEALPHSPLPLLSFPAHPLCLPAVSSGHQQAGHATSFRSNPSFIPFPHFPPPVSGCDQQAGHMQLLRRALP